MTKQNRIFAGYKIKGLRIQQELNTDLVADKLDITKAYLSLIENGKKIPSKKVIKKAALLFNQSEESFVEPPSLLQELNKLTENVPIEDIITAYQYLLHERKVSIAS